MNEIQKVDVDSAVISALQSSVYPGASIDSIMLVIDRCRAGGLDPLMKPFHIVPMPFKDANGRWSSKDVVMPGIGLYRINAARTRQYCGSSAPTFGPMMTQDLDGTEVTYPEWCEVTVYKMMNGNRCEFTAR